MWSIDTRRGALEGRRIEGQLDFFLQTVSNAGSKGKLISHGGHASQQRRLGRLRYRSWESERHNGCDRKYIHLEEDAGDPLCLVLGGSRGSLFI